MFESTRNGKINNLVDEDRPVHNWYRFVLSYPPHLVAHYLERFGLSETSTVLDPFCGTGTTIVECKKRGINSVGVEANPMTQFASRVKTDWSPDPTELEAAAEAIADEARIQLRQMGINDDLLFGSEDAQVFAAENTLMTFPQQAQVIVLQNSISPIPLHKVLTLRSLIQSRTQYQDHLLLALASSAVNSASNLHFGPEAGIGVIKSDAVVLRSWLKNVYSMASDLRSVADLQTGQSQVYLGDARDIVEHLEPESIDAVITSPPYPNEKDYTRITRLETVLLGFAHDRASLQMLKRGLLRSNTRNVYKGDRDDLWVLDIPSIQQVSEAIEARRIELGKTSGFEKLYGKVTKLYFGGMARHLAGLRRALRPGAYLGYVVGDQASYLRVMIRTGQILGEVAENLGYEVVNLDLFRTRLSTATREQLREEVLVLRWTGSSKNG